MPLPEEEPLRLLEEIHQLVRWIASKLDYPIHPWMRLPQTPGAWEEVLRHLDINHPLSKEVSDQERRRDAALKCQLGAAPGAVHTETACPGTDQSGC